MIGLTLAEIAAAVDGTLSGGADPHAVITGAVQIDSRPVQAGDLFVAFAGEQVDGHDFAEQATQQGAVASLVERPVSAPSIVVSDTEQALSELASTVLRQLSDLTVIGITGSSGKTSTKDMLFQVLSTLGATVAPPGSFNNEIGHPYTALLSTVDTRYLILEKSARAVGDIAFLCQIAPPQIGVVLNVGQAHIGEFGSQAVIAQAKGELVEALPPATSGGVAVLNADDQRVAAMAARTRAKVVLVGRSPEAQVRADQVVIDDQGCASYLLHCPTGTAQVQLGWHGEHHVANSLAVAAVGLALGMSVDQVAAAMSQSRPRSRRRMQIHDRADGIRIINDSYNANPDSMRAGLAALAAMGGFRRRWAVLGPMAELGAATEQAHVDAGRYVAELGIDRLIAIGEAGKAILAGASSIRSAGDNADDQSYLNFPDFAGALALLEKELRPGDVVFIKASQSARLWEIAEALIAEPAADKQGSAGAISSAEPANPSAKESM